MSGRPRAPHPAGSADFLDRLRSWAEPRHDVRALAVVGSVARGDAWPDSDIDVVLLTTDPARYLERVDWASEFGAAQTVGLEHYGNVTSVRVWYREGLEVEFGIAPADWASAPIDPGAAEVAREGIVVLLDRDGHATALAAAMGWPLPWVSPSRRPDYAATSAERPRWRR
jgi:predicted nucleotidyltransferase